MNIAKLAGLALAAFLSINTFSQVLDLKEEPLQTDWKFDGSVLALEYDSINNALYVGGEFQRMYLESSKGTNIGPAAGVDFVNGTPQSNLIEVDGLVKVAIPSPGGGLIIGGDFDAVNGVPAFGLAEIDNNGSLLNTFNGKGAKDIRALYIDGSNLYVGGSFEGYGEPIQNAALLSGSNGQAVIPTQDISGSVEVVRSDGNGGWFIGGRSFRVGNQIRKGILYVDPNGQVSSWNPNVNGIVYDIKVVQDTIYIGGEFTSVNGQNRSNVARLYASSNVAMPWNPSVVGTSVKNIEFSGQDVIIGGEFNQVGTTTRHNLAAVSKLTGAVTNWDPAPNSTVEDVEVSASGQVWIGGAFGIVSGQSRLGLAVLASATNSQLVGQDVGVSDIVFDIEIAGDTSYIGGSFSQVLGQPVKDFAALTLNNVNQIVSVPFPYRFGSSAEGIKKIIRDSSNNLTVVGDFEFVTDVNHPFPPNYYRRHQIVRFNTAPNNGFQIDANWQTNIVDGNIVALDEDGGGGIFVGGGKLVVGDPRSKVFSLSLPAGSALNSFNQEYGYFTDVSVSPSVNAIGPDGSSILVGGDFTGIIDYANTGASSNPLTPYNYLVSTSGSSYAAANSYNPTTAVKAIKQLTDGTAVIFSDGRIQFSSFFELIQDDITSVVEMGQNRFAVAGTGSGGESTIEVYSFNIAANPIEFGIPGIEDVKGTIFSMQWLNQRLVVAGDFTAIGNTPISNLAKLSLSAGSLSVDQSWMPNPVNGIGFIASLNNNPSNPIINLFTSTLFGAKVRTNVAAIDATNGQLLDWNPNIQALDGRARISDMKIIGPNEIVLKGVFDSVGTSFKGFGAAILETFPTSNFEPTAWEGLIGEKIAFKYPFLYSIAGSIYKTSVISSLNTIDLLASANATGVFNDLLLTDNSLVVGGEFSITSPVQRQNIAFLDPGSGSIQNTNANINGSVFALEEGFGGVLVGGDFQVGSSQSKVNLVQVNSSAQSQTWAPSVNGPVRGLKLYKGLCLVSGDFTTVNQTNKVGFASLNALGQIEGNTPDISSEILDIETTPNRVFLAGAFGLRVLENAFATKEIQVLSSAKLIGENSKASPLNNTDFGIASNGGQIIKTFTIRNAGEADVILPANPISLNGSSDFTLSILSSDTLRSGAITQFQITYTPSSSRLSESQVIIDWNDVSPFVFNIKAQASTALNFAEHQGAQTTFDRIDVPSSAVNGLNEFTVECMINISGPGDDILQGIFSSADFTFMHFQASSSSSATISVYPTVGSSVNLPAIPEMPYNTWRHVAIVVKSGDSRLYVDGVQIGTTNTDVFSNIASPTTLYLGNGFQAGRPFNGEIDEFRIWSRALCAEEIAGRKGHAVVGNEDGLILHYDFEEGDPFGANAQITEVVDRVGGNNGTLTNFTKSGNSSNWVYSAPILEEVIPFSGVSTTWNGSISTDWNLASNWSSNMVPDQCADVIIPITANSPVISSNQAVNSIQIASGASLSVNPGACLWVGSSFLNNGDFNLNSDATSYAQYLGPEVTATYEQIIGEAGWHSIGSPFLNTTLADIQLDQNAGIALSPLARCNIHKYDNSVYQSSPPLGWTNAWGSWVCPTDISEPFAGENGYALFLDESFADAFPVSMRITGTTRNSTHTVNLNQANGGWNLLSNGFTRVLDWEEVQPNSSLINTYYVWDAANDNYATYQIGGSSTFNATQFIAPLQSVFVRTSTAGDGTNGSTPDIYQCEEIGVTGAVLECQSLVNEFYKQTSEEIRLVASNNNNDFKDELLLTIDKGFSESFKEDEDALKLFSRNEEVTSLYAFIEDKACVIAGYPEINLSIHEIPLGYKARQNATVTIALTQNLPHNIQLVLEDKDKGVFHDLKMPYTFIATEAASTSRLLLHLGDESMKVNELGRSDDYLVYQVGGYLEFVSNLEIIDGQASLFSATGQLVAKSDVQLNSRIEISSLKIGVYLLQVEKNGRYYQQKFFIQ